MNTAKIFTTGRSQAARSPREFRFKGDEVCIKRIGPMVVLFDPRDRRDLLPGSLGQATPDFMVERDQPPAPQRRRFR